MHLWDPGPPPAEVRTNSRAVGILSPRSSYPSGSPSQIFFPVALRLKGKFQTVEAAFLSQPGHVSEASFTLGRSRFSGRTALSIRLTGADGAPCVVARQGDAGDRSVSEVFFLLRWSLRSVGEARG